MDFGFEQEQFGSRTVDRILNKDKGGRLHPTMDPIDHKAGGLKLGRRGSASPTSTR